MIYTCERYKYVENIYHIESIVKYKIHDLVDPASAGEELNNRHFVCPFTKAFPLVYFL